MLKVMAVIAAFVAVVGWLARQTIGRLFGPFGKTVVTYAVPFLLGLTLFAGVPFWAAILGTAGTLADMVVAWGTLIASVVVILAGAVTIGKLSKSKGSRRRGRRRGRRRIR